MARTSNPFIEEPDFDDTDDDDIGSSEEEESDDDDDEETSDDDEYDDDDDDEEDDQNEDEDESDESSEEDDDDDDDDEDVNVNLRSKSPLFPTANFIDEDDDDDSDESSEDDDDLASVFVNEDGDPDNKELMQRGMSAGNLMNEPGADDGGGVGGCLGKMKEKCGNCGSCSCKFPTDKESCYDCVPGAIVACGTFAVATFCCCIFFIPLLALIIGLSVGLTTGGDDLALDDDFLAGLEDILDLSPSLAPSSLNNSSTGGNAVIPPMTSDDVGGNVVIDEIVSSADTTIYRDGSFASSSFGDDTTMLVQNGPPGDLELASAYSLVQFDYNFDDASSKDENLMYEFCLTRATDQASDLESKRTYSTCLADESSNVNITTMTGTTAPDYNIPGSCVDQKAVTFDVDTKTTDICVDVTSLLGSTANGGTKGAGGTAKEKNTRRQRQRGRRRLATTATTTIATANANANADVNANLRGSFSYHRRHLQDEGKDKAGGKEGGLVESTAKSMLFIIDTLESSDEPGDRFYTSSDENVSAGRQPTFQVIGPKKEVGGDRNDGNDGDTTNKTDCKTAVDVICDDPSKRFSRFCSSMKVSGLFESEDLNSPNPNTVFVPIDDAFDKMSQDVVRLFEAGGAPLLDVLLYHISPNVTLTSDDLKCGENVTMANTNIRNNSNSTSSSSKTTTTTLCGGDTSGGTSFYQADAGFYGNIGRTVPKIIEADIATCHDGVIHVIDELLLPMDPDPTGGNNSTCISSNATQSIADIACTDPDFSVTCGLIQSSPGMIEVLSGGSHTVFLPNNAALLTASETLLTASDDQLQNPGFVTNVFLQHVVYGDVVRSSDLNCDSMKIIMANAGINTIVCKDGDDSGSFYVQGPGNDDILSTDASFAPPPKIISADIEACNGVIHVLDALILPDNKNNNDTTIPDSNNINNNSSMPDSNNTSNISSMPGSNNNNATMPDISEGGNDGSGAAAMQQCNICGNDSTQNVTNVDAMIGIPEGVYLPGLDEQTQGDSIRAMEAKCGFVQDKCRSGFCSSETCDKFQTDQTKETCGCAESIEV